MTDRTTQDGDDLYEDTLLDDDSTVADTDEQDTDSDDDRGSDDGDDTPKKTQAEKQADIWEEKTKNGGTLPDNLKWLVKDFPEQFGHLEKKKPKKADIKAVVREEIKMEQEAKDFSSMKRDFNNMDLNDDERAVVDEEYTENRSLGLTQKVSLEKALKFLGNSKRLRLGS